MASNDYGDERFVNLVNSTPESLNTLKELADALRTNSNFSTIVATEIGKKVARLGIDDKVITYTRGDSTSDTITTQDYRVKTEAKTTADKVYLAGTTSSSETVGTLKIDEGIYIDNVSGKLHVTTIEATNVTSSVSGNASTATIAERLSSSAGNATQPIYFADGIPVSTTYALNKTVPSDAKFTDTTYNEFTAASVSTSGSSGLVPAPPKRNNDFTRYLDESGNWTVPVYAGNGLEGTINFWDDGDYGQYQIDVAFGGNGNANTVAHSDHTHNYAGSSSAGGDANSLAGFQATSTANLGINRTDVKQAIGYVSGLTKAEWNYQQIDGALYSQVYSASWQHQIYGDYRTGQMSVRGRNNGTWQNWRNVLDSSNYTSYVTPDGIGAVAESSVVNTPSASEISTTISEIWD